MKEIDVQPQPILSARRTVQIAVAGVKYRLFRAMVTVAVIVVAMAFLMNILTESLIRRSVGQSARGRIESLHRVDRWIARLSIAQSPEEMVAQLASSPAYAAELARLLNDSEDAVAARRPVASQAAAYLRFFDGLSFGRRRLLVGRAEGVDVFDRLSDPAAFDDFAAGISAMKSVRMPGRLESLRDFLRLWPEFRAFLSNAREAQAAAIARVQEELNGRSLSDAMMGADGAFGQMVRDAGFALDPEEAQRLARDVERIRNTARIEKTVNHAGVRQAVAAERDMLPGDVTIDLIWELLADEEKAARFLQFMREARADAGDLDAAAVVRLAAYRADEQLLKRAERRTQETGGGFLGIGKRMTWLALVSMLVCAVGIANAMLMSVTERFREIATLKCLGALDGFIMMVFLIEASVLGLVGGLGGALAGLMLGAGRMVFAFRSLAIAALPLRDLAAAGLISILAGVVLAAAAAVYPSLRAARLAPMEAMRIE